MKSVATIKLKVSNNKQLLDMSSTFLQAVQYAVDKGFEAKVSNRFIVFWNIDRNILSLAFGYIECYLPLSLKPEQKK